MNRRQYSAGAVKFSFWFMEFKTVVKLLSEGMTDKGIPRTILKPILDPVMEHWLFDNGMEPVLKALTGVL